MEMKFEHSALEQDIERLSRKIREQKEAAPSVSEKEIIRTTLQEHAQASTLAQTTEPQGSPILPKYLQQESPEIQLKIEELIDLAFHKGIQASVQEAKKYGPFILDALHDTLTSKLYEELKTRKLI
jgi:hypothetical protein